MNNFPVRKLTADLINLSDMILIGENGNLTYNGKIIAYYEDFKDIVIVQTVAEFNTLNAKIGDIVKIIETGESYIWNGVWIPLFKSELHLYEINSYSELGTITSPTVGDMVNIIREAKTGIFSGTDWVFLLDSGIGAVIQDTIINNISAWSSQKISNELALKQDNLTEGTAIDITDDIISLDVTDGVNLINNDINNAKLVTFGMYDNGTKTADWDFDLNQGVYQKVIIQENCRITILEPNEPCTVYLHIFQGSLGTATLSFPTNGWSKGFPKQNTLVANYGHDLLMVHYYGNSSYVFEMITDIS